MSNKLDVLERLRVTQCCDPVIDGILGAAIEEIEALRRSPARFTDDDLERIVIEEFAKMEKGGYMVIHDIDLTLARRVAERLRSEYQNA